MSCRPIAWSRSATKHKDVYQPGDKVTIDIDVNRKEEVDLVVSIFDKSLLTIAPDHSADIRNFYLADDRVQQHSIREYLRLRLGRITLQQIVGRGVVGRQTAQAFGTISRIEGFCRTVQEPNDPASGLRDSVRLAGIPARFLGVSDSAKLDLNSIASKPFATVLIEMMDSPKNGWTLMGTLYADTILLSAHNSARNPAPVNQFNPWWITPDGRSCLTRDTE